MSAPASEQQTQTVKVDFEAFKKKLLLQLGNLSKQAAGGINPEAQAGAVLALARKPDNEAFRKMMVERPDLIISAVFEVTRLQLYLHPSLKHVYLVPFWGKNPNCQVIIDKRGYIARLKALGSILDATAEVVRVGDHFREERRYTAKGDESVLEWRPAPAAEQGEALGAFAMAVLPDGRVKWKFMPKVDIERHRAASPVPDSPMWLNWWDKAAEKTVMKSLLSHDVPLTIEASEWVARSAGEIIDIPDEDVVPTTAGPPATATASTTPATTATSPKELPPGTPPPPLVRDFRAEAEKDMAEIGARR